MVRLRIKWPSAAIQTKLLSVSSFLGMFPDFSPACAGLFFVWTSRSRRFSLLRRPLHRVRASKPATAPATAKPWQIIFDHDATLGQRKKLPAGKSELRLRLSPPQRK